MFVFGSLKKAVAGLALAGLVFGSGLFSVSTVPSSSLFGVSIAEAACPVLVVNKENEYGELIETLAKNKWLKDIVYCLQTIQSVMDEITGIMDKVQGVIEEFKKMDIFSDLVQEISDTLNDVLDDALKAFDLGSIGDAISGLTGGLTDAIKNGLGGLGGELSELGGKNLLEIIEKNGPVAAASEITDRAKQAVEEVIKNLQSSGGGDALGGKAFGSVKKYLEDVKEYNPIMLPAVQDAVVQAAIETTVGKNIVERDKVLLATAQEQKTLALKGLASIVAKYLDEDKPYRAAVNLSLEQYQSTLKKANSVSSKTSPGESMQAIAGLLAIQVEQLNTQNIILVNLTDVIADEIRVLDRMANLAIENYATAMYENFQHRARQSDSFKQSLEN